MSRLIKYTSAAFGMVLLAGLAYYQGHPDLVTGEEGSLVGTVLPETPRDEQPGAAVFENQGEDKCDPSKASEDPDFENCEKLSLK
ncbi:hypothetical protein ACFL07_11540 [Pseudomonadota bacterium]